MGIANRGIHIGCTKLYIANIFILYMFIEIYYGQEECSNDK